jgi:hypothetical protein
MFFLLFLEFDELLLEHLLEALDELLVVALNLGYLDLCLLEDIIFDLVAVALHGD